MRAVYLLSQSDALQLGNGNLAALLESVEAQRWDGPLRMLLALAHATPAQVKALKKDRPWLEVVATDTLMGLSANRNLLLDRLFAKGLPENDALVAFPDDDAAYPPGLLVRIVKAMAEHDCELLGVTCNAEEGIHPRFDRRAQLLTPMAALRNLSSNTLFMNGRVLRATGLFDESLGVGTPAMSGEDTDFVLRALSKAQRAYYVPEMVVRHPVKPGNPAKYYPGSLLVWARHRALFKRHVVIFSLAKRLLRGLQWVAAGKLAPHVFMQSWLAVKKEF